MFFSLMRKVATSPEVTQTAEAVNGPKYLEPGDPHATIQELLAPVRWEEAPREGQGQGQGQGACGASDRRRRYVC